MSRSRQIPRAVLRPPAVRCETAPDAVRRRARDMSENARRRGRGRRRLSRLGALAGAAALTTAWSVAPAWAHGHHHHHTATPIKHVVVIFGENISFDHYFGTYPHATNEDGTHFTASRHTPKDVR